MCMPIILSCAYAGSLFLVQTCLQPDVRSHDCLQLPVRLWLGLTHELLNLLFQESVTSVWWDRNLKLDGSNSEAHGLFFHRCMSRAALPVGIFPSSRFLAVFPRGEGFSSLGFLGFVYLFAESELKGNYYGIENYCDLIKGKII